MSIPTLSPNCPPQAQISESTSSETPNKSATETPNQVSLASPHPAPTAYTFTVGVNYRFTNKGNADKLSGRWAWRREEMHIGGLENHVSHGYPWMPALIDKGRRREQRFCNEAQVFAIDVDDGWSIEEAMADPFVQKYCALGIESASSGIVTEKNPDGHEKFRLVCIAPFPIKGYEVIRICNQYLATMIGDGTIADPACKDASRFFFGAKGKVSFIRNFKAQLPESFLNEALDWNEAEQAKIEARRTAAREKYGDASIDENIQNAIAALKVIPTYTPGERRYDGLRTMMAGVLNDLGDLGRGLLLDWDQEQGEGDWGPGGLERILDSLESSSTNRRATLGSLFHLAKERGFAIPKQKEKKLSKAEKEQLWLKSCVETLNLAIAPENLTRAIVAEAIRVNQLLDAKHTRGYYSALPYTPIEEHKLWVLDGEKGTGKTSGAIKSLTSMYPTGLIIAPSNVLANYEAGAMGFSHFADNPDSNWVALCPESLHKVDIMKGYSCIIFDECNEDIYRLESGNLGVNPEGCREKWEQLLPITPVVVLSSDDAYKPTLEAAKRVGEFKDSEIEIIQRKRLKSEMLIRLYMDDAEADQSDQLYHWLAGIIKNLEKGDKVLIPCGAQGKARAIDRLLRARFPGKKGLCIDGKYSTENIKKEFAKDPDSMPQKAGLDWLIYSPVFNSGVSIESNYWDHQFEYVCANETSTSASQRGERWRPLLNGQVQERHIYLSRKGQARHPAPAMFTPDYWEDILRGGELHGAATQLAKNWQMEKLIEEYQQAKEDERHRFKELAEYWAIHTVETYLKLELLEQEWRSNGWTIGVGVEHSTPTVQQIKEDLFIQKEIVVGKGSNSLACSRPVKSNGQDSSPLSRTRDEKYRICEMVGFDAPHVYDQTMIEAWHVAPGRDGGFEKARRLTLLRIAIAQPDWWREINYLSAQKMLFGQALNGESLPESPVGLKEMQIVNLLLNAPLIKDIVTGGVKTWKWTEKSVQECAEYLRSHAKEFARLSKHSQLIRGLQFTKAIKDIKCVNKALRMLGLETTTKSREDRYKGIQVYEYGLKTAEDAEKEFAAKVEKREGKQNAGMLPRLKASNLRAYREKMRAIDPNLYRQWIRLTSRDDRVMVRKRGKNSVSRKREIEACSLQEQITAHIKDGYRSCLMAWRNLFNRLTSTEREGLQLDRSVLTEVLLIDQANPILNALLGLVGGGELGPIFESPSTDGRLKALDALLDKHKERISAMCELIEV